MISALAVFLTYLTLFILDGLENQESDDDKNRESPQDVQIEGTEEVA